MQDLQEEAVCLGRIAEFLVDQMYGPPQGAQCLRFKKFGLFDALQSEKGTKDGARVTLEDSFVAGGDIAIDELEFIVDFFDLILASMRDALQQRW